MAHFSILPRGKKIQIAYKLRLLDLALIRSNGPDEVLSRSIKGLDHFVLPDSKIRHAMREFLEIIQRAVELSTTCRAQNYCSACPACWLFGTLGATGDNKKNWSLSSRIDMAEAIALEPGTAVEMRTTNAVDPETMKTNSSLTRNFAVPANTEFYGTITLETGNPDLVLIALSSLLGVTRVGARSSNHGLCTVEIIGTRESFLEDPAWAPQVVAETGVLPKGAAPRITSMIADGAEDALVEALVRFNDEVVKVAVAKLTSSVNNLVKPGEAVTEALTKAETGVIDFKGLLGALRKLVKAVDGEESKEALNDIITLLAAAGKSGDEAIQKAVLEAAEPIREILSGLGLSIVAV